MNAFNHTPKKQMVVAWNLGGIERASYLSLWRCCLCCDAGFLGRQLENSFCWPCVCLKDNHPLDEAGMQAFEANFFLEEISLLQCVNKKLFLCSAWLVVLSQGPFPSLVTESVCSHHQKCIWKTITFLTKNSRLIQMDSAWKRNEWIQKQHLTTFLFYTTLVQCSAISDLKGCQCPNHHQWLTGNFLDILFLQVS